MSNSDSASNDPLNLTSGDNPGNALTTTPFSGTGFLGWSRSVRMALGAKQKLGFIDGTCAKPDSTDPNYQRWIRCDYMVTCWLLNSMVSELSEAFLYAKSAEELWSEINERYGHSNGLLVYQLQHDLSQISQGNMSVAAYYGKLKRCWDELSSLTAMPVCTCGKMDQRTCKVLEKLAELENRSKLMQFLMKLNNDYENVRSQILSMDPLPSVTRAYYIIQQVEKQKQVTTYVVDPAAFFANDKIPKTQYIDKKDFKGERNTSRRYCTHCHQTGHTFDQCFETIGYPDWYKAKKGKKGPRMATNVNIETCEDADHNTPFDMDHEADQNSSGKSIIIDQHLVSAVCQEVMKMFREKCPENSYAAARINPSSTVGANFAGSSDRKSNGSWQAVGRGSGSNVSKQHENATPAGSESQRQRSSLRGGRAKQWRASSNAGNGSDHAYGENFGPSSYEVKFGGNGVSNPVDEVIKPSNEGASESSSLNLDQSFLMNVWNGHSEVEDPGGPDNVCETKNSECPIPLERFDICPPKSSCGVVLKPSLLAKIREKRNDMKLSTGGPKGTILRSGMILLKNYLSSSEQVKILRLCQTHGLGPAGFYQPRFREGGKLHLKLMCFGKFWDCETKYGEVRPMDGAKPPPVPQEFMHLVDRAINDAHSLIAEDSRIKNVEDVLPPVKPDICLVKYYATTGRLGLHQDKDEGRECLDKGIPIVSFSIGDSAEFLYSDQRDAERAQKVILESGDVLIFGGKSRHIYHGVSTILPDTAPKSLLEETNFRPGRINLTFKQHF